MSLLKYLKQNEEALPDPRNNVSSSILSQAIIAFLNCEVKEELSQQKNPQLNMANISSTVYNLWLAFTDI